jgi:hypothetical protein
MPHFCLLDFPYIPRPFIYFPSLYSYACEDRIILYSTASASIHECLQNIRGFPEKPECLSAGVPECWNA